MNDEDTKIKDDEEVEPEGLVGEADDLDGDGGLDPEDLYGDLSDEM